MARQEFKVQANNFTGGLITEASPLSFPENSCLNIENMDINTDGSVVRRQGLRAPEADNPESTEEYTAYASQAVAYVWRQAGGIPGNNLVCMQDGTAIVFYTEQEDLGSGLLTNSIDLSGYLTESIDTQPPVSMTNVRGVLVITASNVKPISVEFIDTTPATFNVSEIKITARDLDGLDDALANDTRPGSLSDQHYYNLLNQGWSLGRINSFFSSRSVYPSNADVWSAGRDANNNFSPAELVKIDFGTTPAPKGRLIQDIFNTATSYAAFSGAFTNITAVAIESDSVLELTSAGHGLADGDNVNVQGVILLYDQAPFNASRSIDGLFAVSDVTTNTFRITIAVLAGDLGSWSVSSTGEYSEEAAFTVNVGYTTLKRPTVVATYAGRAFYTGIPFDQLSNKVFFSQILTDTSKRLGLALQEADPTSEIDADIVATDGGVITINDLGDVVAMYEQGQNLVILSSNGVWEIGGETEGFFSATGYTVRRVTSVPVVSGRSVISVEGTLMFMGEDGIYMLQASEISGFLTAVNLTANNISSYYLESVMPCREFTAGVYDYKNRRVLWLHGLSPAGCQALAGSDPDKGRLLHRALVFNLTTESFTKYIFPFQADDPDDSTARIIGAVAVRGICETSPAIRFYTRYPDGELSKVGWLTQDKPRSEGFADSTFDQGGSASEVPALLVTGNATIGDVGTKKTARQLILHMLRTEEGFTVDGETFTPIHPSGAKVRIAWDFTSDEDSNKWQAPFEGYRYRQLYVPSTADLSYNTGYEVITTKTKLRGTGRAFSMRFNSEPGKDMNILGWSITGSVEASE